MPLAINAHDRGAPVHFDRDVQDHLDAIYPNQCTSRGGPVPWSPDLISRLYEEYSVQDSSNIRGRSKPDLKHLRM